MLAWMWDAYVYYASGMQLSFIGEPSSHLSTELRAESHTLPIQGIWHFWDGIRTAHAHSKCGALIGWTLYVPLKKMFNAQF